MNLSFSLKTEADTAGHPADLDLHTMVVVVGAADEEVEDIQDQTHDLDQTPIVSIIIALYELPASTLLEPRGQILHFTSLSFSCCVVLSLP